MAAMVRRTTLLVAVVFALMQPGGSARQLPSGGVEIDWFFRVAALDDRVAEAALARIADAWKTVCGDVRRRSRSDTPHESGHPGGVDPCQSSRSLP
jgi:hypothetical protein